MRLLLPAVLVCVTQVCAWSQDQKPSIHVAIVGLAHDHVLAFLPRLAARSDVQLAGIVESDHDLVSRCAGRFHLETNLFFASLEELLARTNVQAAAAFTSTFEHRRVVESCARLGVKTVMMEKPLAVNLEHARAISAAAEKSGLRVLVNYETTWYAANRTAFTLIHDQHAIGDLRKFVFHAGHRGPKDIGCSSSFLAWLTDPVLNGGGALNDFGCYGADLMTWLMDAQRPTSVFAVTQQFKPDVYPKVEDEAIVVVTYPKAQGIIQASWNWPFERKDAEFYGQTGYVLVPRPDSLRVRLPNSRESNVPATAISGAEADPISYLAAVARGELQPSGLSSLAVNMTVVEILDAAHKSARTGKRVDLPAKGAWE